MSVYFYIVLGLTEEIYHLPGTKQEKSEKCIFNINFHLWSCKDYIQTEFNK